MKNSFEDLAGLSQKELDALKLKAMDELAEANQRRWDTIAAILFYQAEKERLSA